LGNRWHFENVGQKKLCSAVLRVLFKQLIENRTCLRAALIEEIFAFLAQSLSAFTASAQRRVERYVAKKIERIGVRLFCCFSEFIKADSALRQLVDDLRAVRRICPFLAQLWC